ncbi:MAG: TetR/AcrR family transcriptional regulator [Pseudophaeobacter sp. bin_em_oilr2.035]|uniref:TetR/AcrR family transcriptional regulator n=2 Tax=Alphaproteobacteria TaxID=28211 RepID=A0ABD4X841_9RHOB|nr:TetR/AcrR family transcriptional regulator [Phaeobacter gallaeciensis]MDF1773040.1 TetR/AcrR family transcriptional regulator [Pseudophaeobacter sp. bin_em_oilr2.035]MEC9313022.1 TetR/AcrR family transcriptional regulator [Pseudomonadota bacterium]MDE4063781.1 TetR/AcrR family transcriptional regulator [Phaeobacter gallaeciensis]MDE4117531.1 TetR/AcrR family transcriptional regulator [Phaeobacter gallaeciensis]MDE4122030.1 TetR/AcrR family transcriptional regulator [Phaeobacter gallaeciensi
MNASQTLAELSQQTSSADAWLMAAYEELTAHGVGAVKIMPLAKKLGVSRTSFYWYFKDREALLEAMIRHWEDKNTGNLVARTEAYAENLFEAVFNLFDCWLDPDLFDSRLDLAIRNWARSDPSLQARLDLADARRKRAMTDMLIRYGYDPEDAEIRALTMIYTQIGYISMQVHEDAAQRLARMPGYMEVFTGQKPAQKDIDRFMARHR